MLGLGLSLVNVAVRRTSVPAPPPDTATYLTDDAGNRMTTDSGDRLILETA